MAYRTTDRMIEHQLEILRSQLGINLELHCEGEPSRYYLMSNGHTLGHHEKKSDFYSSLFMANELLSFAKKHEA